jgi:ABC-type molybdate transport system substrate-binding protein
VLRASSWFAVLAIALVGCGRPSGPAQKASPEPASLEVYAPCLLSIPIQRAVARFQESHHGSEISVLVDKPLAQLAEVRSGARPAGVAIAMGEIEMNSLVAVAPAATATKQASSLKELASPTIKRIFIEDPARSSLGDRATRGLKDAGLWPAVSAKAVRPEPNAMILAELLSGKADAALVFKGCLFAEKGPHGAMPKTIRIVGELPAGSGPPISYQAAPLAKTPRPELARDFVGFLLSPEGREALREAGVSPVPERSR